MAVINNSMVKYVNAKCRCQDMNHETSNPIPFAGLWTNVSLVFIFWVIQLSKNYFLIWTFTKKDFQMILQINMDCFRCLDLVENDTCWSKDHVLLLNILIQTLLFLLLPTKQWCRSIALAYDMKYKVSSDCSSCMTDKQLRLVHDLLIKSSEFN